MKRLFSTLAVLGLVATHGTTAGASPQAAAYLGRLAAAQAVRIPLDGNASALVYWLNGPHGADVVTTIDTPIRSGDGAPDHILVRFEATLQPGQSQRVAVPAPLEAQQQGHQKVLRIRRSGDHMDVGVEAAGAF